MITWVNASAGSGKTYSLIEEIKKILSGGVSGNSILCLSFSNAAASEIKNRLLNYSNNVLCYTIHSFCNTFYDDFNLLDEIKSVDLINELINNALQEKIWFDLINLLLDDWGSLLDSVVKIIYKDLDVKLYEYNVFQYKKIEFPSYVTKDLELGKNMEKKILEVDHSDYHDIFKIFLTKEGELRKKIYSKNWGEKYQKSKDWLDDYFANIKNQFNKYQTYQMDLKSNSIGRFINYIKEKYKMEKLNKNLIDFNDLIKKTNFSDYEILSKIINIKYIFVDEAQDLSEEQWKAVLHLYEEIKLNQNCDLYIVGDEKQSIYNFGFNASLFQKYKKYLEQKNHTNDYAENANVDKKLYYNIDKDSYKNIKQNYRNNYFVVKNLNYSYRSSQQILNFVDKIMINTSFSTKHVSKMNFDGRIEVNLYNSNNSYNNSDLCNNDDLRNYNSYGDNEIYNDLIEKIFELQNYDLFSNSRKIDFSDIMILIPKRNQSTFKLLNAIKHAGIPISEHPFYVCYDHVVEDLINIAKFVIFKDTIALTCLLHNSFFRWNYADVENLFLKSDFNFVKHDFNLYDFLENLVNLSDNGKCFQKKVDLLYTHLTEWIISSKCISSFFGNLIFKTNYGKYLIENESKSVNVFLELINDFSGSYWLEFFDYIKNVRKLIELNNNGIKIKTIHASKGLESKIVFLFDNDQYKNIVEVLYYNNQLIFPMKQNEFYKMALIKHKSDSEKMYEKLLYVALTRAQEQLYIYTVKNKLYDIISKSFGFDGKQLICGLELTKNLKKLS